MIRWLFWDIGDTLVGEDRLRYGLWELLLAALRHTDPAWTFGALMDRRERLAADGDPSPHYTIARDVLSPDAYAAWREVALRFVGGEGQRRVSLLPGVAETLDRLAARHSLGIIADQPPSVVETLRGLGIGEKFAVVAIDALVGASKPDERLYRWALDRAGCSPGEAVMIGNRLDRDVAPARRIGMRAIFCYLSPSAKGYLPVGGGETAYFASLARVPNWPTEPATADEVPDARVAAIPEIVDVLAGWTRG